MSTASWKPWYSPVRDGFLALMAFTTQLGSTVLCFRPRRSPFKPHSKTTR